MASSDEIKSDMKSALIGHAEVVTTEKCYSMLDLFLDEALVEHTEENTTDYTTLHVLERRMVVILAWISVCYARASGYAPQPSQKPGSNTGYGFGADRDTPYRKCMDLAEKLRARYDKLKDDFENKYGDEADSSGDIVVGDLIRNDSVLDITVPYSNSLPLSILSFEVAEIGANFCRLSWGKFSEPNFHEAYLFQSSTTGIHEEWNHDGKDGIPFVSSSAEKIYYTTDFVAKGVKIVNLAPGTYYFVLVAVNRNEMYSFSDELQVVIPTP